MYLVDGHFPGGTLLILGNLEPDYVAPPVFLPGMEEDDILRGGREVMEEVLKATELDVKLTLKPKQKGSTQRKGLEWTKAVGSVIFKEPVFVSCSLCNAEPVGAVCLTLSGGSDPCRHVFGPSCAEVLCSHHAPTCPLCKARIKATFKITLPALDLANLVHRGVSKSGYLRSVRLNTIFTITPRLNCRGKVSLNFCVALARSRYALNVENV